MNLSIDIDNRTLRNSTIPPLTVGTTEQLRLRFFQRQGDEKQPDETYLETLTTMRASLSLVDEPPVGGRVRFGLGGTPCEWLKHDANDHGMTTALQAAGTVGVAEVFKPAPGLWVVRFDADGEQDFEVMANELMPRSFAKIRAFEQDGRWWHEVRLVQTPASWAQTFSRPLVPKPTIKRVQAGAAEVLDENGNWGRNEIQRLTIPVEFVGSHQLKVGVRLTRPLGTTDDPDVIAEALNALYPGDTAHFEARTVDPTGEIDIEFIGPFAAQGHEEIEVVPVSWAPGRVTVPLDLKRAEIRAMTWGRKDTTAVLELFSITEHEPEGGPVEVEELPLLRQQVVLRRENISDEMATALMIDWLRPPSPRTYLPPNPDHIRTGTQYLVRTIGDGESAEIVVQHALGTEDMHVSVRQIDGGLLLTDYTTLITDQEITLIFPVAPAENSLRLMLIAAETVSQYQAHGHSMAEIVNLMDTLAEMDGRIQTALDLLLVPGAGARTTDAPKGLPIALPALAEVLPATRVRGERTILPALPRAIETEAALEITGDIEELPDAAAVPGAVYVWGDERSGVFASGGGGRRGQRFTTADGEALISNGYFWTPAVLEADGLYYPEEMRRVLWEISVTPEMLAPGLTLRVQWPLIAALLADRPELQGVYTLRVRKGRPVDETGAGDAVGLSAVVWDTVEGAEQYLMTQRILLTRAAPVHSFGVTVARALNGTLAAGRTRYGAVEAAPAPAHTHFILRAELARFDLVNYADPMGLPDGQVYLATGEAEGFAAITKTFNLAKLGELPPLQATIG